MDWKEGGGTALTPTVTLVSRSYGRLADGHGFDLRIGT